MDKSWTMIMIVAIVGVVGIFSLTFSGFTSSSDLAGQGTEGLPKKQQVQRLDMKLNMNCEKMTLQ